MRQHDWFKMLCVCVFVTLVSNLRGTLANDQNVMPSQVVKMTKNIDNPVISSSPLALRSYFVPKETNFFFNARLLLGTFLSPPIEELAVTMKTNIIEPPIANQGQDIPKYNEIKELTESHPLITSMKSIVEQSPFLPLPCINESNFVSPNSLPSTNSTKVPVLPEVMAIKKIPHAPILPPIELTKITKIVEQFQILPPCNKSEVLSNTVSLISMIPDVVDLEKDSISMVTNKMTMEVVAIPAAFDNLTPLLSDVLKLLNKEKTVILVPQIPTIIHPSYLIEPVSLERIVSLHNPIVCARDIIMQRVRASILTSKTINSKSVEFVPIPTTENPILV